MDELVEHVNSKHQNAPPTATAAEGGGEAEETQQGENHVNGVASGVSCSALFCLSFHDSLSALHIVSSRKALSAWETIMCSVP